MSAAPPFDATDRPAAGTACAACRAAGHFCPAKGYAGEQPLCLACGAGEPCGQATAVLLMEQGLQFDDMQVDERGGALHGECRTIPIEDADRVAAPETAAGSAWTIKASLSAANLVKMKRQRPVMVKPVRVKTEAQLERERNAGRRRRMSELTGLSEPMESATILPVAAAVAPAKYSEADARAVALRMSPESSAEKISALVGWSPYFIYKWLAEGKKGKVAPKPGKKLAVAKPVTLPAHVSASVGVESQVEIVSLRVPVAAMDKLFLLLPVKVKISAVESVMAELAGL